MGKAEKNISINQELPAAHGISNPARLLTLREASRFLGLTVWALRERVWAGAIPYLQFPGGRKIYLDREDLEKFIQGNKKVFGE